MLQENLHVCGMRMDCYCCKDCINDTRRVIFVAEFLDNLIKKNLYKVCQQQFSEEPPSFWKQQMQLDCIVHLWTYCIHTHLYK